MWAEPYNPLYVWGSCFHQIRTPFIQGGASVQQRLSAAFGFVAHDWHRGAADKRYSLNSMLVRHRLFGQLNGWQRLWLLAAAIWLPVTVTLAVWTFPTEAESRAHWSSYSGSTLQSYTDRMNEVTEHCKSFARSEDVSESFAKHKTCWEANKPSYENASLQRRDRMVELHEEGERQISEQLPKDQALAVAKALGLWLIPSFLLYALGLGIAWVRRGFGHDV